jgi:hypothetical protein
MSQYSALLQRSALLLRTARFMTLATMSGTGQPWASTVNYIPLIDTPLRLVWYSMRVARHSSNIGAHPAATGSIFRVDLGDASPIGLDGFQFAGRCREIPGSEVETIHAQYYLLNFPDEVIRRQWTLPIRQFHGDGLRRFYEIVIEDWWLLDIDRWLVDKCDQRIALPDPSRFSTLLNELEGLEK